MSNVSSASISVEDRYLNLFKDALCASLYDESAWLRIQGPMKQAARGNPFAMMRRAALRGIIKAFERRGVMLVRQRAYNARDRQEGFDWPLFGYTMTGRNRLDCLQRCIQTILIEQVPGDIVETGVWRGGSMILAAAVLDSYGDDKRSIWCCDSFEGMPKPTVAGQSFSGTEDFQDLPYLAVSVDQVRANFDRFGVLSERVKFLKGWFRDTLPKAPIQRISVLRLDGDLYESTLDALTALYPKVSSGGFVIVDDYGTWPGCKQAVEEYRQQHQIAAPLVQIDPSSVFWRVPSIADRGSRLGCGLQPRRKGLRNGANRH
jgi:O-methyltransferase